MGLRKTSSKLTLVDLAGSERMDLIGTSSLKQREESININKSLFNLKYLLLIKEGYDMSG